MKLKYSILAAVMFCAFALHATTAPKADDVWASGRADEAIRNAAAANTAESQLLLCKVYYALEDWDNAVKSGERAVQASPNSQQAHLWLGRAYGSKAEHAGPFSAMSLARKTVSEFEKAVQMDPRDTRARLDLAEFYANAPGIVGGGRDKARKLANDVEGSDPLTAALIHGMVAESEKDFGEAERQYRRAIDVSKDAPQAWLALAHFYKGQKRWNDLESAVERAVVSRQHNPEDMFVAGELLVASRRNLPHAVQILHEYLKGSRSEYGPAFRAHYLAGQAFEFVGDKQKAIEEYRAALSLASGYRRAQQALKTLGA